MTRSPQTRRIPIPEDLCRELEGQRERFREKFGRDPGPEDPVFFDPDALESRPPRNLRFFQGRRGRVAGGPGRV